MKLGEIYRLAIEAGIEADPRGREAVEADLAHTKETFDQATGKEREFFETEKLSNPYADTRIVHGDPDIEVGGVLVGIDVEVGEILLADRLRATGRRVDAVIGHHPEGRALAQFHEVMRMQSDILARIGVPVTVAEGLLGDRIREVSHRILPINHTRAADAARALDIPMLCIHTPADNLVTSLLQRIFDERRPRRVDDVVDILLEIPEYRLAAREVCGPVIAAGQKDGSAGRVFVDMTGGTEGSKEIFSRLPAAGIGTVVCMHLSEEHLKEAGKNHVNVVVAGHIASDNVGINLLLDRVSASSPLEVIATSGFQRVTRDA